MSCGIKTILDTSHPPLVYSTGKKICSVNYKLCFLIQIDGQFDACVFLIGSVHRPLEGEIWKEARLNEF